MTPRQAASAASVSEPAGPVPSAAANRADDISPRSGELIRPAAEIFDHAAVTAELTAAIASAGDAREIRRAAVTILRRVLDHGRATIAKGFEAQPRDARAAVSAYTYLVDCVVQMALDVALTHLHPTPNPTEAQQIALLGVGGYGRAEMAPHSDVDLLFLIPWKKSGWSECLVESMLYILWDLHLKVGHATRSVRDCLRLGRDDMTIRTALLEHRFIGGTAKLAQELRTRLQDELFRPTASEFIEAKIEERDARHRKYGVRYVVEPNVKEGKGGLRDLQTLFWISKYLHGVRDTAELVAHGTFTQDEYDAFFRAESFLLAVRCHLHLIAGRAHDQLTFDLQVEVAARMGYRDAAGRRAVEYFMQDYYRHATWVGELTRIFLTALEDRHLRKAPTIKSLLSRRRRVRAPFSVLRNRLTVANSEAFLDDSLNMLRIFDEALRTGLLIHPEAMRLIRANLDRIDDALRVSPEANRIFVDMLLKHGNPERALRRMNEVGVLGAFIPEFAPVVAMMQFNMYHHFTVDEHTVQCISNLAQIERGELTEELPIASGIFAGGGVNRRVLYVAMLLHDIGKGRDEDHSVVGARVARRLCPRLGLRPSECETVEWLVRYHLLMSDMAQKRDLADPRTVRDFAKAVQTRKRLDLLTILTTCDIRGVGPGVWNNWKAQLLRGLHKMTANALETGLEDVNRGAREAEAKRRLREALADWPRDKVRHETQRHYGPYWQGLPTAAHAKFAELLRGIGNGDIRIDLVQDEDRDATRACFAMVDHPGIFSRLAGALALVGANVVDARTYTTKDGFATACFWLQDASGHPYEEERLPRLREMICKTLLGEVVAHEALTPRDKIKKRERAFNVPTSITFDNEGSDIYTLIEVDTRDRPALLYDLTRTLADAHIQIASAVIATYGEQVVDTFYVKDMFGLKLHTDSKRRILEKRLRDAIAAGAERARR